MESAFNTSDFTQSIAILFTVIAIKLLLSKLAPHSPMKYFQFYCTRLAEKVNKPTNGQSQQVTAGVLATLITLTPIVIILWLFESFVEVTYLWQALLLFLAFDKIDIQSHTKQIAKYLTSNKKFEAKEELSKFVLRDTKQLSTLGLSKASIETLVLTTIQQILTVCFIFICFGALTAFTYRLILEMHYSWNQKLSLYQYFGAFVGKLVELIQWLPCRAFSLSLLVIHLTGDFLLIFRLAKRHFFRFNNNIAIAVMALTLGCKLGGPAIYEGEKKQRPRFNDHGKQPEISDIIHANRKTSAALVLLSSIILIPAIVMFRS